MSHIIAESVKELKEIEDLLSKDVPTYRQAYSDRTAWIMACLSELAYVKFNPIVLDKQKKYLLETVSELIGEQKKSSLETLIDLLAYDHNEEKNRLIADLSILDITLERTFDNKGTQAILLSNSRFYILAFRGTEPTSIRDIKSDLKASTVPCETGGKIHKGFKEAFAQVAIDIQNCLDSEEIEAKPLFITGHSLGGALATLATKKLSFKYGIAGCYTFGSPRVADEEWMENVKTPIYRLVNSADPVTMLPPGADLVNMIGWVVQAIPHYGSPLRRYLLSRFGGYYHVGNMRYLTNAEEGRYEEAKLLYSVSILRRLRAYIRKASTWKKIPKDHSITVYRKKLKYIAQRRQKI